MFVLDQGRASNAGRVRGAPGLVDEQRVALPQGEGDHVPPGRGKLYPRRRSGTVVCCPSSECERVIWLPR